MNPSTFNHSNLLALWHLYGAAKLTPEATSIWHNVSWPYRCWVENPEELNKTLDNVWSRKCLSEKLIGISPDATFSLFQREETAWNSTNTKLASIMIDSGFQHTFSQMAMYLPLTQWSHRHIDTHLDIRKITNETHINEWVDIGSNAFEYTIDSAVIAAASNSKGVSCLIANYKGKPVATALLFQSGNTMGIHQIAVKPDLQGKGIARQLMTDLMSYCQELGLEAVFLQASEAGKPLYDSLGFLNLFEIHNYQISN